jgi:hypothetical protein
MRCRSEYARRWHDFAGETVDEVMPVFTNFEQNCCFRVALAVSALVVVGWMDARAAEQDEIQVYTDDINKPGEFGLEMHFNYTPSGRTLLDYPGEITNNHATWITPEFSYGLTRDLEVGLYVPIVVDGNGDYHLVGGKLRLKWMPIQAVDDYGGMFLGANVELARVGRAFSDSQTGLELKPIFGAKSGGWLVSFNPNLEWDLSNGLQSWEPLLAPAMKLSREVSMGVSLGAEYYSDMGKIGSILPWNEQKNSLFATIDVDMKPLVFNFGVGHGLTGESDKWTIKAIWEVPVSALSK